MKIVTLRSAACALGLSLSIAAANAVEIGDINIEDLEFETVGTAEYTDPFFQAFFETTYGQTIKEAFGIDAYTTTVALEEAKGVPGYYRLVHPYKDLCEKIIPTSETWGAVFMYMEDGDYIRISATDPQKAYIDNYLMENTGIYPMDGINTYEAPLYASCGAWWLKTSGVDVPDSWYLHGNDGTYMMDATESDAVTVEGTTVTPLFTIAMWSDPVTFGTVETHYDASPASFKLVISKKTTGVDRVEAISMPAVRAGRGCVVLGEAATVTDLGGRVVSAGRSGSVSVVPGVYIVSNGKSAVKVAVR